MPFVTSVLSALGESQQHDAFQVTLGIWISLHLTEYEYAFLNPWFLNCHWTAHSSLYGCLGKLLLTTSVHKLTVKQYVLKALWEIKTTLFLVPHFRPLLISSLAHSLLFFFWLPCSGQSCRDCLFYALIHVHALILFLKIKSMKEEKSRPEQYRDPNKEKKWLKHGVSFRNFLLLI